MPYQNETKRKFLLLAAPTLERRSRCASSPVWGRPCDCPGPTVPLDYKSHSQDKKKQNRLSNTSKVATGHTINQRYHTTQTLRTQALCTVGSSAGMWEGEEIRNVLFHNKKASDLRPLG